MYTSNTQNKHCVAAIEITRVSGHCSVLGRHTLVTGVVDQNLKMRKFSRVVVEGGWTVRGHLEASNRSLRSFLVIVILVVVICVPKRLDLGGDWILRS